MKKVKLKIGFRTYAFLSESEIKILQSALKEYRAEKTDIDEDSELLLLKIKLNDLTNPKYNKTNLYL